MIRDPADEPIDTSLSTVDLGGSVENMKMLAMPDYVM